ncbi:AAA ATPase-like protein [Mycolicibacterium mucogenicum 261Sha1.1M5]|nr:AAA ATPase-like protein [Mycolicibacterium mucogenicum 261Sha1.1M5]
MGPRYEEVEVHIKFVEIENFRRLKSVRVDFDPKNTLLVGPNNSGKTSVIAALAKFLKAKGKPFRITDFCLDHLQIVNKVGADWVTSARDDPAASIPADAVENGRTLLEQILPALDVWLSVSDDELSRMPQASPYLMEFTGAVGVRLRLEPRDVTVLAEAYVKAHSEALKRIDQVPLHLTQQAAENSTTESPSIQAVPRNLVDFLDRKVDRFFEVRGYLLSSDEIASPNPFAGDPKNAVTEDETASPNGPRMQPLGSTPHSYELSELRSVILIDEITATRGITEGDADGSSTRLSKFGSAFNRTHFHGPTDLSSQDRTALSATQGAVQARNHLSRSRYGKVFEEISKLGYPGGGNPTLVYEEDMPFELEPPELKFRHQTDPSLGLPNLDESLNGLGYQSLIYMAMKLIDFRKRRLAKNPDGTSSAEVPEPTLHSGNADEQNGHFGVAPIHLVLIEEPEAFLHAQVQQLFIQQARTLLREGVDERDRVPAELATQLVVSTHSSHIVQNVEFSTIRYLRRRPHSQEAMFPESTISNLTNLWGDDRATHGFVSRYIRLRHCNMFFADALVLVEGAAETMLLPHMFREFPNVSAAYLELLEVGGSHAHRLRKLIECLGVPTLIVSDIDASDPHENGKKAQPKLGESLLTKNPTLKKWFRQESDDHSLDTLFGLSQDEKVVNEGNVRFAYQIGVSTEVNLEQEDASTVFPSTFEDALILENLEFFQCATTSSSAFTARVGPESSDLTKNSPKIDSNLRQLNKVMSELRPSQTLPELAEVIWKLLQRNSFNKAEFALDLVVDGRLGGEFKTPTYIREGLEWLDEKLKSQGLLLFEPADEAAFEQSASVSMADEQNEVGR